MIVQQLRWSQRCGAAVRFARGATGLLGALAGALITLATGPANADVPAVPRIAHAGGGLAGLTYTNSLDALSANAAKFELFEIDFNFTSDGKLVCIHDWAGGAKMNFGRAFSPAPTLQEFEALNAAKTPKNCTLATLIAWLERNPGKRIVTDVKDDNLRALTAIAQSHPDFARRFIPQIYQPDQYAPVVALGYTTIIFTMYRYFGSYDQLLAFASASRLFAVAMPPPHVPHVVNRLRQIGIPSYVHTINTRDEYQALQASGVAEIYTDWFAAID
jgi:glycerophosphoryl diester phosphodiesterase